MTLSFRWTEEHRNSFFSVSGNDLRHFVLSEVFYFVVSEGSEVSLMSGIMDIKSISTNIPTDHNPKSTFAEFLIALKEIDNKLT